MRSILCSPQHSEDRNQTHSRPISSSRIDQIAYLPARTNGQAIKNAIFSPSLSMKCIPVVPTRTTVVSILFIPENESVKGPTSLTLTDCLPFALLRKALWRPTKKGTTLMLHAISWNLLRYKQDGQFFRLKKNKIAARQNGLKSNKGPRSHKQKQDRSLKNPHIYKYKLNSIQITIIPRDQKSSPEMAETELRRGYAAYCHCKIVFPSPFAGAGHT